MLLCLVGVDNKAPAHSMENGFFRAIFARRGHITLRASLPSQF